MLLPAFAFENSGDCTVDRDLSYWINSTRNFKFVLYCTVINTVCIVIYVPCISTFIIFIQLMHVSDLNSRPCSLL